MKFINKLLWGEFAKVQDIWRVTLVQILISLICVSLLVFDNGTTGLTIVILAVLPFFTQALLFILLGAQRNFRMDQAAKRFFAQT